MKRIATAVTLIAMWAAGAGAAEANVVSFSTPSGNIGCVGSNGTGENFLRCDIRARSWQPPRRPAWCEVDWGLGYSMGPHRTARWVCAGDTALGSRRVLAYGRTIRIGRIRCTSRRAGLTCRNASRFAFTLSRERATRFRLPRVRVQP